MSINWQFTRFGQLTCEQLYQLLQLREKIFIVEQNCPYLDADGQDRQAIHLLGIDTSGVDNNAIVASLRLLAKDQVDVKRSNIVTIGRLVVDQGYRGRSLGRDAMRNAIAYVKVETAAQLICLSGQSYLHRFYTDLGFIAKGEIYLEDGIEHQHFEMHL